MSEYPDVLGVLAGERMAVEGVLHSALGVQPAVIMLDQPFEALILLQSLIDQPLTVKLALRTPTRTAEGGLLNFFTPRPRLSFTLPGGDCGLLHLPVVPQLPTPAGKRYSLRIDIAVEKPDVFRPVRPPSGGEPPRQWAIPAERLEALRAIPFGAKQPGEHQLGGQFAVRPGEITTIPTPPQPRYEPLWTVKNLAEEQQELQAMAGEALRFARGLDRGAVHVALLELTQNVFSDAGQPVHPGEAIFITKALAYAASDGLELEEGFALAEGRWFHRLCRLMTDDPGVVNDLDRLLELLYTAILHDAVRLAFNVVGRNTGVDFGDSAEQADYAARLVAALETEGEAAPEHVYVPLVLAGVLLNAIVTRPGENPWRSLDTLREAREGRRSQVGEGFDEVFDILDILIGKATQLLREMHIPPE